MRRVVSTVYYSVFHLLVEDFVANWPFADQRTRLARMFDHRKMRDAGFTPNDDRNLTPADDISWNIVVTDVINAITLAEDTFAKWRSIRAEIVARDHLLSMFGANR